MPGMRAHMVITGQQMVAAIPGRAAMRGLA